MTRGKNSTRAAKRCRSCRKAPPHPGGWYCERCIRSAREKVRCPDCDSDVIVLMVEGQHGMHLFVAHDETCPSYNSRERSKGGHPS